MLLKKCPKCSETAAGDSFLCRCGYQFTGPEPASHSEDPPEGQRFNWGLSAALLPWACFLVAWLSEAGRPRAGPGGGYWLLPGTIVLVVIGFVSSFLIGLSFCITALRRVEIGYGIAGVVALLPLIILFVSRVF